MPRIYPRKDDHKKGPVYDSNGVPYNYIVIIDAGSSGSRVHIYHWTDPLGLPRAREADSNDDSDDDKSDDSDDDDNDKRDGKGQGDQKPPSKPPPMSDNSGKFLPMVSKQPGQKWVKRIRPGISTFGQSANKVGRDHLKPLLDYARDIIPKSQQSRTPIFLHATGGMRLLPPTEQTDILREACSYIQKKTEFFLPDCLSHINVISGETEGIFGWLGLNYMIGGIDNPGGHDHGKGHSTYGMMELGGASAQVVFAPNSTMVDEYKDDLYKLNLAGTVGQGELAVRTYDIYTTTWLGYGVNEAMAAFSKALIPDNSAVELDDPCMPRGASREYGELLFKGTGNFTQCAHVVESIVTQSCDKDKNSIGCLLLNSPKPDFDINHFIGVSEFYDSTHDVFQMGGIFDYFHFNDKLKMLCNSDWNTLVANYSDVDNRQLEQSCFKGTWVSNLLTTGLGLPKIDDGDNDPTSHNETLSDYLSPFQSTNNINGSDFSWTLGKAMLYASSEMNNNTTSNNDTLVGFYANNDPDTIIYGGEIATFQRPSLDQKSPGHKDDADWDDLLDKGSHRIWGALAFLIIGLAAVYLLLGKSRRHVLWQRAKTRGQEWLNGVLNRWGFNGNYKILNGRSNRFAGAFVEPVYDDDMELQGVGDEFIVSEDESR